MSLSHDTRNNAFLPTDGHLIEASFEKVTGSFKYPRAEFSLKKYFTHHKRPDGTAGHVSSLAFRAAYTGSNTPICERFFAGGSFSIRGFQFRDASPRVYSSHIHDNVSVGGNLEVFVSVEDTFPIMADVLGVVVFHDIDTVQPVGNIRDTKCHRAARGFGLRIRVPAIG